MSPLNDVTHHESCVATSAAGYENRNFRRDGCRRHVAYQV